MSANAWKRRRGKAVARHQITLDRLEAFTESSRAAAAACYRMAAAFKAMIR